MHLAIVDIDNIVCENEARRIVARESYLAKCQEQGKEPVPLTYNKGFDWNVFFQSDLVYLDTLIPGANDVLNTLIDQGYTLVFLSSRPEHMRADTVEWFALYVFIRQSCEIILKAEEDRYQKTTDWKVVQVQHLIAQYQPSEVLLVDDQQSNLAAIAQVLTIPFRAYLSLTDAIKQLR